MSDDTPKRPDWPYPPDYLDRLPPAPPIRPDLSLIGDMHWPEKKDRKPRRWWQFFSFRSWPPS